MKIGLILQMIILERKIIRAFTTLVEGCNVAEHYVDDDSV